MSFDAAYALEILPTLLRVSLTTLQATIAGFIVALVGGLVLALCRQSRIRFLSAASGVVIEFIRSTPFLIQLFFLFFVLPRVGIRFDPLTTGILGLGLHFSAYTAEVYRAGIESVGRGQWEAAVALDFSVRHTWTRIILPQAIPPSIPALGNYLIGMFKDSAILATISVAELLGTALNLASLTFRYLEPLLIVGAIYLAFSLAGAAAVRYAEGRLRRATSP